MSITLTNQETTVIVTMLKLFVKNVSDISKFQEQVLENIDPNLFFLSETQEKNKTKKTIKLIYAEKNLLCYEHNKQ